MRKTTKELIGREKEQKLFREFIECDQAGFLALWGRRRIGKTFLVEHCLHRQNIPFVFVSGEPKASKRRQLEIFRIAIEQTYFSGARLPVLHSWNEAFDLFTSCVIKHQIQNPKEPSVLFLDELPWLDTPKSGLLSALNHAWNTQLKNLKQIRLIVCGSAASWMIKNIVSSKGGLHNRITHRIHLEPFTLDTIKKYFIERAYSLSDLTILQLAMVFGGVPYYLSLIKKGESATQAIERLCFSDHGLSNEFSQLYAALFKNSKIHERLTLEMSKSRSGLTRAELLKRTKLSDGAAISKALNELEEAGFIASLSAIFSKRGIRYRLIDPFVLFHFRWLNKPNGLLVRKGLAKELWKQIENSPEYRSWQGYAFEDLCITNLSLIVRALGIQSKIKNCGSWSASINNSQQAAQIDLVIDRNDGVICLCEIKFGAKPFTVTQAYAAELENKRETFKSHTKTEKSIFNILITPFGVTQNEYAKASLQGVVKLNDLLEP